MAKPIDREIVRLALPALGALVAEPLYVLADTAVVGRLGLLQLDGLALASTALLTIANVFIFLAYGTTASVSRLIGADKPGEAAGQAVQSLWLAAALGVTCTIGLWLSAPQILEVLGGSEAARAQGLIYLRISLFGLPAMFVILAATGYLRGDQNTTTPLVITLVTAVGNLVLELILIFGFGFGIGASALSTVVVQYVAVGLYLSRVVPAALNHRVRMWPRFADMKSLLRVGADLIVRTLALRGVFTLSTAVAARIGDEELAAHHITFEVVIVLALAMDAIAIAGQALVGRYLGAGDAQTARSVSNRMMQWGLGVGIVGALLVLALAPVLPGVFSEDETVQQLTTFLLMIAAAVQIPGALAFVLDGILIGAGDMRFLAKAMVGVALVFAPLAIAMVWADLGIGWLWAGIGLFMACRVLALGLRFRTDHWLITGG